MDGFYVAFVAVGVGLFWLSIRRRDSLPGSLLAGWVFLGVSLAIAPVAFAALALPGSNDSNLSVAIFFEILGHVLLAAATICVGVSCVHPEEKHRNVPESETAVPAEALEALASQTAPGRI